MGQSFGISVRLKQIVLVKAGVLAVCAIVPLTITAQARKTSTQKRPAAKPSVAAPIASPAPTPTPVEDAPIKKNEGKANARPGKAPAIEAKAYVPTYFYTFERPGFTYGKIIIEHDEDGKGQISMKRDGSQEMLTDPIQLSTATMAKLNNSFAELNFLDSSEDYQYAARDYSHMGNITITRRVGGKERTAKFNWTENKGAKALMDEYRAIGNEYTWRLELASARDNQPLLTPGLMETMDGYVQRGEISDPPHLIPFLTELSHDERIPLMGRNRATHIIERIQKKSAKP